jgi:hypothetical protein
LLGTTLGLTTSNYEDISCNAGSIAVGLNVRSGGILDTFGIQCAVLTGSGQPIVVSSLGTSSKSYPYSQLLSMTVSGTLGTGAVTYAIASGGTASGCALTNSTSSATISATSSGTCLVAATIAADASYQATTSPNATFTFNKANQSSLAISTTAGNYGTALALSTAGGSGTGSVTYASANGTTSCTVSGANLTAAGTGTCLVTATKDLDANYNSISSTQTTITFSQGATSATITITGTLVYRQSKTLTIAANTAGKITLRANQQFIPGCRSLMATAGNSYTVTCAYKPAQHGAITITALFTPTSSNYSSSTNFSAQYWLPGRTGNR